MLDVKARVSKRKSFALSFALVVLVAFAVAGSFTPFFFAIVLAAPMGALGLNWLFPGSRLLWISFISLVAVYASVFQLFVDDVFSNVAADALGAGFLMPIVFFLVGSWWRRKEITLVVSYPGLRGDRGVIGALYWLMPVFVVGVGVLNLSRFYPVTINSETGFFAAMTLIGLIVLAASRDVAIFLVDSGLLFEEFFQRVQHLVIPAFAFLTFYALVVITFAAVYRIISVHSAVPHFMVGTRPHPLSFSEALHYSIVTFSTVGYGDILPLSGLARMLTGVELVLSVVLYLIGVSEIMEYARERRKQRHVE